MPPPLRVTLDVIAELVDRWPDLNESRIKGTRRPLTGMTLGKPVREDDGMRGIGETPAPVHLDVLDTMRVILGISYLLHEHVSETLALDPLPEPRDPYGDPRPFLRDVAQWLPRACEIDPEMAGAAHEKATHMRVLMLGKLGELVDGQTLDAVCPFCNGSTGPGHRDVRTLRVRVARATGGRGGPEPLIVCENVAGCTVLAGEAGVWVRGNPAWPVAEWDWLAKRLNPRRRRSAP